MLRSTDAKQCYCTDGPLLCSAAYLIITLPVLKFIMSPSAELNDQWVSPEKCFFFIYSTLQLSTTLIHFY